MEHIAIDLGTRKSQVCVRDPRGEIEEERPLATEPDAIRRYLSKRAPGRVIVETGAEAFWVAEIARECGHEVRVVPSMLAPSLGVGRRGLKSDQRDARVLSETSCRVDLPSVHIPRAQTRRLQSRLGMRQALVRGRTQLTNVARGYLRTVGERETGRGAEALIQRVRTRRGERAAELEAIFGTLEALNRSIDALETELEGTAHNDELVMRLQSVPGVGLITSLRFVATLDEASRFANGARVSSYIGLVPSERSSGLMQRKGSITKAGSPEMRAVLVQAAWAALRSRRHRNDPMMCWARALAKRRGRRIAVVALARKLSGILFALWRDGTRYEPLRAARMVHAEKLDAAPTHRRRLKLRRVS